MGVARGCSVPSCGEPHLAKGLCKLHYDRARYWAAIRWLGCRGDECLALSTAVGDRYMGGAGATRITSVGGYVVRSASHVHRASTAYDFGVASAMGHGGNSHVGAAGRRGVMAGNMVASSASARRPLPSGEGFSSSLEEALASESRSSEPIGADLKRAE